MLVILGVLLLAIVPRFTPIFHESKPSTYCGFLRAIRTYLEIEKEKDIVSRAYPDNISTASIETLLDIHLTDPYTSHEIYIETTSNCSGNVSTDIIRYCPIRTNGKVFSYKLGVSQTVKNEVYPGCLIGVDRQ
ncbi:MAG: hypothetical protein GXO59_03635 [Dictyoglomi bacterium]|nr:hypothetical protein [Dictyoglomota bacterium]